MKGFKGTPGPYTLGDENNSSCDVNIGETVCSLSRYPLHGDGFVISRDEMLANAGLIIASYDLAAALKELIFLHGCEQEGMSSGQPTRKQWLKAYDAGVAALEKAGIDLSEI